MKLMRHFRAQLVLISIVLMALAVIGTMEISTTRFLDTLWEQDRSAVRDAFGQVEEQIVNLCDDANHCRSVIRRRPSVLDFFLNQGRAMRGNDAYAAYMIHDMATTLNELKAISGVIFAQDGKFYGTTPHWNFNGEPIPEDLRQLIYSIQPSYAINWCGAYSLEELVGCRFSTSLLSAQRYIMGVSREYCSTVDGAVDVIVLTLIDVSAIENILRQLSTEKSDVALMDTSGNVLAGADMGLPPIDANANFGELEYSRGGADYRVFYSAIQSKGWVMAQRIDKSYYLEQTAALRRQIYIIGICAIAVMAALLMAMTYMFLRPFRQVMGLFRQVSEGNLRARLAPFDQRALPVAEEMQTMRTQLNGMLDSISRLIDDIERKNRERAVLEMQELQRQLNPHMIFNTLTSIRWMIMLQGDNWPGSDKVNAMMVEFAALLQPLFDDPRSEWTLREELAHLSHYMELLRMRYCADFSLDCDVDEHVYDIMLPRFVLQPVLENSCEHGMAGSQSLRVALRVYVEDGYLCVSVEDDGCGIAPERMELLCRRLSSDADAEPQPAGVGRNGIGLINVHRQLRFQFGADSGLDIQSQQGKGTRVTLRMALVDRLAK